MRQTDSEKETLTSRNGIRIGIPASLKTFFVNDPFPESFWRQPTSADKIKLLWTFFLRENVSENYYSRKFTVERLDGKIIKNLEIVLSKFNFAHIRSFKGIIVLSYFCNHNVKVGTKRTTQKKLAFTKENRRPDPKTRKGFELSSLNISIITMTSNYFHNKAKSTKKKNSQHRFLNLRLFHFLFLRICQIVVMGIDRRKFPMYRRGYGT